MKKRRSFLLVLLVGALVFVLGVWLQSRRLLPSSRVQDVLVQKIQSLTEGTLHFQNFQVDYFPQPRVVFEHPQLTFSNGSQMIEADQLRFDFDILPLFTGRAEPSAIYVFGGKGEIVLPPLFSFIGPLPLHNFSLKMGSLRPNIPIPVQFFTNFAGRAGALSVKGHAIVDSMEKWSWEKASGHYVAELKDFDFGRNDKVPQKTEDKPFIFKTGLASASVEIDKKPGEIFLELKAFGEVKRLGYEVMREKTRIAPSPMDITWDVKAAWNQDKEELKVHKVFAKLPFVNLDANGGLKVGTGEIANLHFVGTDMVIEELLKYAPGLENALPFQIGFSGPSKWVLSAEGTLEHLTLHLNWDMTQLLLTYGQYFSKAKDIPLSLNFDYLIQKGSTLSGDFSARFKDLSVKGNLSNLDLKTGVGQLNLITNKFSLEGWQQFIPLIQQDRLGGAAKFLANWKGDLRKLEKTEQIFNLTLEKGSWTTAEGQGIKEVSLSADYSPLMFECRQAQLEVGGSSAVVDLKISGKGEKVQAEGKIASEAVNPGKAWAAVTELSRNRGQSSEPAFHGQVKSVLDALFPQDQILKKLSVEGRYADKALDISNLQFESYEGQASLKGMVQLKEEPRYRCDGEIRKLNLGSFLTRHDPARKILEGTLTMKGALEGRGMGMDTWAKSLSGEADFTLENAKFQTFDLKDEIALVKPLARIGEVLPSMRDFEEVVFHGKLENEKIVTTDLLMKQKDYLVDGEGTVGFNGISNFRMEVFLSSSAAARILPEMASSFHKEPQAHFGPIPVLLSGPLSKPDLKLDPSQITGLTEKISRKKSKELLVELVLE